MRAEGAQPASGEVLRDFAECAIKELEQLVKPSGFYKSKAKNIRACCVEMVNRFVKGARPEPPRPVTVNKP